MTDLYQPMSILKKRADIALMLAKKDGVEPQDLAPQIADAQMEDYARLTDPAPRYDALSMDDRNERGLWSMALGEGLKNDRYDLVTPGMTTQSNMVSAPELSGLVEAGVQTRNANGNVNYGVPKIAIDKEQVEPVTYARGGDTIYVNEAQAKNPDAAAIATALDTRYDRRPETLRAELTQVASEYANEKLPPAYDRVAYRVRAQAELEGWAVNKDRLTNAMANAAYEGYSNATDPANPQATEAARNKLLAKDGVNIATDPEITEAVNSGTATMNQEHGQNYAPPTTLLVKGLADSNAGTPALFDRESDTVQIDEDYAKANPGKIGGVIGHELGHRYQRSQEETRTILIGRYNEGVLGEVIKEQASELEIEADRDGAKVVGAAKMKDDLNAAMDWAEKQPALQNTDTAEPEKAAKPAYGYFHPTRDQRNQYLDELIAKEGVKPANYSGEQVPDGISEVEAKGPSQTVASAQPQRSQVAALA